MNNLKEVKHVINHNWKLYKGNVYYYVYIYFYDFSKIGNLFSKENLSKYVLKLIRRFKERNYELTRIVYEGIELYALKNNSLKFSIYFDFINKKVYVERKDLEERPRLVNYCLLKTFSSLKFPISSEVRFKKKILSHEILPLVEIMEKISKERGKVSQ